MCINVDLLHRELLNFILVKSRGVPTFGFFAFFDVIFLMSGNHRVIADFCKFCTSKSIVLHHFTQERCSLKDFGVFLLLICFSLFHFVEDVFSSFVDLGAQKFCSETFAGGNLVDGLPPDLNKQGARQSGFASSGIRELNFSRAGATRRLARRAK